MVMDRLLGGSYIRGGRKDFLRDIRSVFSNAMMFHGEEEVVHHMAKVPCPPLLLPRPISGPDLC
eukprot:2008266-Rhodomonas_salina.1